MNVTGSANRKQTEWEYSVIRLRQLLSSCRLLSTSSGRESYDKFRSEISGHVAEYLRPYCKDTCKLGRITSDVDFKFLIKRVSWRAVQKFVEPLMNCSFKLLSS